LPFAFVRDRWLDAAGKAAPFVRRADGFEDFVVRCVRWAFANVDPRVGRVFFSEEVADPFLRWRMKRHGITDPPFHVYKVDRVGFDPAVERGNAADKDLEEV
jgi:hypothetical protein